MACGNIFKMSVNPKPLELGSENFETIVTTHCVSCVTCHMSHVPCHVSRVKKKWWGYLVEGLLLMGLIPSSLTKGH